MNHQTPTSFTNYNILARIFHWGMALVILVLLIVGFYMGGLDFSPFKLQVYGLHKSFGLLILFLWGARLLWRFLTAPPALEAHARWERTLAHTIHIALYILMMAMPLSGWLMSVAGDHPASFFGLFEMPKIIDKNEVWQDFFKETHEICAFALIGAIGLHIVGALKHHVIDKDATLRRMGGHIVLVILGLGALCVALGFVAIDIMGDLNSKAPEANVSKAITQAQPEALAIDEGQNVARAWVIDPNESRIDFTYKQYGQPVGGYFKNWSGKIIFDPQDVNNASVNIDIDVSSIATGSADRDEQARNAQWFDTNVYPRAVFMSESFEHLTGDNYRVHGVLTLHGRAVPVDFPFTLKIDEKSATMRAEFTLNRLDFNIGQGQWAGTDAIGDGVDMTIVLAAHQS